MPISPDRIFVAVHSEAMARAIDKQANLVERLNDRIVRQARRYVYGTNDAQLRFVERRLGEQARWSSLE
jgi:hypothetical protein